MASDVVGLVIFNCIPLYNIVFLYTTFFAGREEFKEDDLISTTQLEEL
jgi:hypothetical protein